MFDRDESKDVELTPELQALEQRLAGLSLGPLQMDRDRLMFEAGRAAERAAMGGDIALADRRSASWRRGWIWPMSTAVMTAACLMLAAMLVWKQSSAQVVAQHTPQPTILEKTSLGMAASDTTDIAQLAAVDEFLKRSKPERGYLGMRYVALTRGVGELPSDSVAADENGTSRNEGSGTPATSRELIHELLPGANGDRSS